MKIAIDGRTIKLHPSGLGIWNIRLIEELLKTTSHEIFVITSNNCNYDFPSSSRLKIVSTSRNYQFISLTRILTEQIEVKRILDQINPDIYHATDSFGIPLLLSNRIKTILTIHDLIPMTPFRESMTRPQYYLMYRPSLFTSLYKAQTVIAISENTYEDIKKLTHTPQEKIKIIYDGIDSPRTFQADIVSSAWNQLEKNYSLRKNNYILYVGGFGSRRNIPTLIHLFRKLLTEKIIAYDTKLILSGRITNAKAEAQSNLSQINKLICDERLTSSVILLDYLTPVIKSILIDNSLFFISLSVYEGFGLAPLEALQRNKDTYSTRVGIWKSYSDKNSFLIENPYSINEMLQKIDSNMREKNLKKNTDLQALINFVKQFSWKKMATQYHELYLSLLD